MTQPHSDAQSIRNVLLIMCDQLRADYLSCYAHSLPNTPHIDELAGWGVRFERVYVQCAVCGASRMSTDTGRYVSSHGAMWNFVPLSAGHKSLGECVRLHGIRRALMPPANSADATRHIRQENQRWGEVAQRLKLQLA